MDKQTERQLRTTFWACVLIALAIFICSCVSFATFAELTDRLMGW